MVGIKMNAIKLAMLIMAVCLIGFIGTAAAIHHHDGHSSHGIGSVHHSGWWHPSAYSWHSPVTYHWYTPYYNAFDPWWTANVYGPVRSTYYWYGWGW